MNYRLEKNIRDYTEIRTSFDALAQRVFGLSFEQWYRDGYWTDRYKPYVLLDGGTVVASIAVNRMQTMWRGKGRSYIQLGTVMTDPQYRKQGLSRCLMEQVLRDYCRSCDAVYLFANDSALDFYPRFGFERAVEYQFSCPVTPNPEAAQRLDMENAEDRALLQRCYRRSNPFSRLPLLDNEGLLMFYCTSHMRDRVYYLPERETIFIASYDGGTMFCYDIYGGRGQTLEEILAAASPPQIHTASLGFTPICTEAGRLSPLLEEDETLFILRGKENIFKGSRLMFPRLSHA